MEVFHEAPVLSSFTPLAEHQSHTPESFYSGPPVLYHRAAGTRIIVVKADLDRSPALTKLLGDAQTNGSLANGQTGGDDEVTVVENVDVWVNSEYFLLFRPDKLVGVSIPYPSISLHAIQRLQDLTSSEQVQGLLLQVTISDDFDDHDQDGSMEFTIVPANPPTDQASSTENSNTEVVDGISERPPTQEESTPIAELFAALSACANLHSSPASSAIGDGDAGENSMESFRDCEAVDGLPPPMPGSGGWITAENMGQFFDEEGNWRGQGLGPGAGVVREREDEGVDANGLGTDEMVDDEIKWRRTG